MNSAGITGCHGIKRSSGFGVVILCSFLLSILFVTQAFGAPYAVEGDAGDLCVALVVDDEAFDIRAGTSDVQALTLSESSGLDGSSPSGELSLDDPVDLVKFIFDWGDGTISETDFVDSGTNVSLNHSWSGEGVYCVRVRAEDVHGASSNWSEALDVTIVPRIDRVLGSRRSAIL